MIIHSVQLLFIYNKLILAVRLEAYLVAGFDAL
jgi:hypothetical protein